MAVKEVLWTAKALKGLDSIYTLIAKDSETAAKKVVTRILEREEQLQTHPDSGTVEKRLKLKREYRYLIESHYKIIYREGKTAIYVVKVFDTRQHPSKINK
ncbi:MAG: type II toxin-antitoxin system RelE/ParE family toxin [Flavobacteriales bacterium]